MSELIKREDVRREIQASFDGGAFRWQDGQDLMDRINALPAASPWHRVEDGLPEPHKDVLVSGMEAINNMRVYKVMVNDNGTWRPTDYAPSIRWDYWMSFEPPEE